ncbi:helix-turn-helix protein [Chitinophaga skermanii]|uniref:Helix-turn-helix protein n=1 Tax=Chitinophaga skermanii TaxID=331697 RepID=A0A327R4K0_9BACT|nr:helix-turn-helix transcriptional regulator [Chitinophaga skermanii]RAJ10988.1 helix-turn-helix protein [Chitinophaga skermanii]
MQNELQKLINQIPEDASRKVELSFLFTQRILDILEKKGMSQKELAVKLKKSESEISKWMKGAQNFTFETVAKIEIALGEKIIIIPGVEELPEPVHEIGWSTEMHFDHNTKQDLFTTLIDIPNMHYIIERKRAPFFSPTPQHLDDFLIVDMMSDKKHTKYIWKANTKNGILNKKMTLLPY